MLILNKYINKNYANLLLISKKITSNKIPDYEDLLHEVILDLYNKDRDLIMGLIDREELAYYIVRMMVNQYHSSTSPFFNKYKKYYSINKQYLKEYIFNNKDWRIDGKSIEQLENKRKSINEKLNKIKNSPRRNDS